MLRLKRQTEEFHNGFKFNQVTSANGTQNNTTGDVVTLNFEMNNIYKLIIIV